MANGSLEDSREWFRNAGFGMFVHWGLYSIPGGVWKGEFVPWFGEWIMHSRRIPVREYEQLAGRFNPIKFNARQWVELAEKAGMKYIVFTAKHHEGFAMFNSQADRYNIVESTPFKRDPVAELAEACKGTGVRLALYYSQAMDWHEPHGCNALCDIVNGVNYGNDWDFPLGTEDGFSEYMNRKAKPQIKELLTQYGPIAMMWFDNPMLSFTREHAVAVKNLVRETQPGCLISARIGHGLGDIGGYGDNYVPNSRTLLSSEACVTMNDTWGFKYHGGRWKSVQEILALLRKANAANCNLLLNIGPKPDGEFPFEAVNILEELAEIRQR
jgi:alpha-L-fucosidase